MKAPFNPKTETGTADDADFADEKQVSFPAGAPNSPDRFRLQVSVYPRHPRHPRFQLRKPGSTRRVGDRRSGELADLEIGAPTDRPDAQKATKATKALRYLCLLLFNFFPVKNGCQNLFVKSVQHAEAALGVPLNWPIWKSALQPTGRAA